MNYSETLDFLFNQLPVFQHVGTSAYKPGLQNTIALDNSLGNPHRNFKIIHVAGTNGKGSTSHLLAAALQESGYKCGLFTSPHLVDFRERMRVNGEMISEEAVIEFVDKTKDQIQKISPSFFELTTLMAFDYFAASGVEVAVIETGLGGRLDSTNIVQPDLCIITNISMDHTLLLGHTLTAIAGEKAGIIKRHTPVVIGEAEGEVKQLFIDRAHELEAPIYFAQEENEITESQLLSSGHWMYHTPNYPQLECELGGSYQTKNCTTVLTAIDQLKRLNYHIEQEAIYRAFLHVTTKTGLRGRWQQINSTPKAICDTAHNTGGIAEVVQQLKHQNYTHLHIVLGMVNDKDIAGVLALLPQEATYYFTAASIARALPPAELQQQALSLHLIGNTYSTVAQAYSAALEAAQESDFIYVGGSSFVVADLLCALY